VGAGIFDECRSEIPRWRSVVGSSSLAGEKTADGADESNGDVVVATGAVSPSPDAVVVAGAS
jgi:hypothetical protein